MENIGQRIAHKREAAGLNQSELARRLGVSPQAVQKWESGVATPRHSKLADIASHLSTSVTYLLEGQPEKRKIEANAEFIGMMDAWEEGDPLDDDDCEVPYFAEVEFAGGNGMSEVIEVADRKLRFSNATLRAAGVDCESAAVARISGNSMERLIMDGAAIGFDMSDTSIIDGEIYAFNHGGLLRTKYLYRLPGGGVRIKSENEDDHPEETMTAEQWRDQVKMLGRVFWWSTVRRSPRKR